MLTIPIPLGISLEARPSLANLRKRAKSRVQLVAANHADLDFLKAPDFAESCSLEVVDGKYQLVGIVPPPKQPPLREADAMEGILRDDDDEARQIQCILKAIELSSHTLDKVANILATSDHVKADIRTFERSTGVQTRHIRQFLYQKQASFDVTLDGASVSFKSHSIRTAAQVGEQLQVLFTPARPSVEGLTLLGRVDATCGDGHKHGVQSGGRHEFRFGLLEPWQAAAIQVASHLNEQVLVSVYEVDSTCTLSSFPVAVFEVHNWPQLVEQALVLLSKAAQFLRESTNAQLERTAQ